MAKRGLLSSSIGMKYAMALSALFLILFLLQHASINILSVFSPDLFNEVSHFMGTNILVQFLLQPILIFGITFHFVMGIYLTIKNRASRDVKYKVYKGSAGSTWMSRNMLITGLTILAFFVLHFIDFWIPELNTKYIQGDLSGMHNGEFRYYEELVHKFQNPLRVGAYVVSFVLLALHLMHGFWSSFQSLGANHPKWMPMIKAAGMAFSIVVPLVFVFIAMFHYFVH